jgi:hypothetical protein
VLHSPPRSSLSNLLSEPTSRPIASLRWWNLHYSSESLLAANVSSRPISCYASLTWLRSTAWSFGHGRCADDSRTTASTVFNQVVFMLQTSRVNFQKTGGRCKRPDSRGALWEHVLLCRSFSATTSSERALFPRTSIRRSLSMKSFNILYYNWEFNLLCCQKGRLDGLNSWALHGQSSTPEKIMFRCSNKARVNEEKICNVLNILNPLSEWLTLLMVRPSTLIRLVKKRTLDDFFDMKT